MKKFFITALLVVALTVPFVALAAAGDCDPSLKPLTDAGLFKDSQHCTANSLIVTIVKILLAVLAGVSVLFIVIGGFQYITSAGNEEQAGKGKKTLMNAIIGLVIAILSYTIVAVVINATKVAQ